MFKNKTCANNKNNSDNVRVLFWNARSVLKKREEISLLLKDLDVLVIVETWLTPEDKNFSFPDFSTRRHDRSGFRPEDVSTRGGGLLFLVRNTFIAQDIEDLKFPRNVELAGIRLTNVSPQLDVLCCYRAPSLVLSQFQWDEIFNVCRNRANFLFVGDFNSHHVAWNCEDTDPDGERLMGSVEASGVFLHNFDTKTRLNVSNNTESNIDLVFSGQSTAQSVEVSVMDETLGSDHYPIRITVAAERHVYRKRSFNLKSKRTNWAGVGADLDGSYGRFFENDYVNVSVCERYLIFMSIVSSAVIDNTPVRRNVPDHVHRNPVPWWDEECERAKRLRRAAFKKFRFSGSQVDLVDFQGKAKAASRLFRYKKKGSFRSFAETISFRTGVSYVWNKCKIFKNKWVKVSAPRSFSSHQGDEMVLEALRRMCPPSVGSDPSFIPTAGPDDLLDAPFGFFEFNVALESKNEGSACGMDGIDYSVLRALPIKYKLVLLDIFNEMYATGEYPEDWDRSFVHFIPKSNGAAVRPISLISCVCKLFETMVKNKLQWWVECHQVLPPNQTGFRRGHSTVDSLLGLTVGVEDAFSRGSGLLAAFLDVDAAFPSVNPDILLLRLKEVGVSSSVLRYVKFSTNERRIYCDLLGDECRKSYLGVPQGGVLSPLLYNIYVAGICKNVPKSVVVSQFADDIAVYSSRKSLDSCKGLVTRAIDAIADELLALGLVLSPPKTVLIYFNRRGVKPGDVRINVRGHEVVNSESARFLGIIFDYKLDFCRHVKQVQLRCSRALNIIAFIRGVWWGSDPSTLLVLYKSFVRSIIDYGLFCYLPPRKKALEKLEGIQNKAVRLALGFRVSTPLNLLLAESKLVRISDRAVFLGTKYLNKVLTNTSHVSYGYLSRFHGKLNLSKNKNKFKNRPFIRCIRNVSFENNGVLGSSRFCMYDVSYEALMYEPEVDVELGRSLQKSDRPLEVFDKFVEGRQGALFFTDGSKLKINDTWRVGSASLSLTDGDAVARSIDGRASIFTAESIALLDAVQMAARSAIGDALVFSDSLSALLALKTKIFGVKTNPYILKVKEACHLFHVSSDFKFRVRFFWVPGHSGIGGNERADVLARGAAGGVIDSSLAVPFADLTQLARDRAWEDTQAHIREVGAFKGVQYVQRYLGEGRKPWFHGLALPRSIIVTVSRCRVNHYGLEASLARKGIVASPDCPCGPVEQDLNHVLWHCAFHEEQRVPFLKELQRLKVRPPYDCEIFLRDPNVPKCLALYRFLKSCNLYV